MANSKKDNNQDIEVIIANGTNYSAVLRPSLPNSNCKQSVKITIELTDECDEDD